VYYVSQSQLKRNHLKQVISAIDYDVAYINGVYSWYFSILPIKLLKTIKKPIIISARGMLNPQAFSVKGKKKKVFLKMAKLSGLYKGVRFHATNKEEANCIKNEVGRSVSVQVAPNLPRVINLKLRTSDFKQNPVRFVNIARVSIEKGTLKMLKAVRGISRTLELDLFGPIYDNAYWEKCQVEIEQLPKHIKVSYKGVLDSNDVPKTLCQYDFFILLSEGENFGHAILEALAVGLPVIISNKTPWRKLELKRLGWDLDINNENIVKETIEEALLMSNTDYSIWSRSARDYAKEFMNDPKLLEQNKALFLNTI
jgi:glycosyltransferase involved in cell wall biosynthesis